MENNLKRIYINRKLNHFAIHLKLAQYCKKNSKKFLKISISKKNCDRFLSQFNLLEFYHNLLELKILMTVSHCGFNLHFCKE